jgi:hypothetical protein
MIPFITTMHEVQITIQTDEVRGEREAEKGEMQTGKGQGEERAREEWRVGAREDLIEKDR